MKLQRTYKQGTLIKFKWYDDYRNRWENPSNFRVIEGEVEGTTFFNRVIAYDKHNNMTYSVDYYDIIQSF